MAIYLLHHVHNRHADWRLLAMHPEHFRRNPVHPSHLGGGHGWCAVRLPNCVVLLLCGKFFVLQPNVENRSGFGGVGERISKPEAERVVRPSDERRVGVGKY